MITIYDIKKILPGICNTYRIKYVELFGSIARNEEKEEYDKDDFLCSAVERQFEILGEALNNIKKINEEIFNSIEESRGAISFRNIWPMDMIWWIM